MNMVRLLCKVINNDLYRKPMENFINRIDLRLVSNEIDSLNKMDIKTELYIKKKYLTKIQLQFVKKVTLMLNKPAYVKMCILGLSKIKLSAID